MRGPLVRMAVVLAITGASRGLAAQQVRGTVRDSASAVALPGAVVSIVDSAGTATARTIADGSGHFILPRAPRAATLHVIRIGYQPRDVSIPASAGDVTLEFAMRKLPAILGVVRVTDRELCPGSTDRGSAFQLWEQARAGLLAAVVAREANPAMVMMLVYDRRMYPNDDLVRRQSVISSSGRSTRPFAAAEPPASFAARGYMREDRSGRTFFAPDADVLLDESFAATHCFHLQAADDTHRDQIGLGFVPAPARGRDSIVDVNGVIWMDRATPALRSFDFRFTQLEPAAERAGIGGHLEFRNMSNGVSFIERWNLRLPIMEPIPLTGGSGRTVRPSLRRQDNVDVRTAEILEAGGQVLSATWPDHTSWREGPMGVAGTVTQRLTHDPVPFARVTLAGTADTVTADARGEFTMMPVLPGKYTIVVADTTLESFAGPRIESQRIDVARGALTTHNVEFESAANVLAKACKGQKIRARTATLMGRVTLADGTAPRNATVRATWQADYNGGSTVEVKGGAVTITNGVQDADTDDHGWFIVCGVAIERPIRLRVTIGGRFADTTVVAYDSVLKSFEWRPSLDVKEVVRKPPLGTP